MLTILPRSTRTLRCAAHAAAFLLAATLPTVSAAAPFAYISNTNAGTDTIVDTISIPAPFGVAVPVGEPLVYLLSACAGVSCAGAVNVVDTNTNAVIDTVGVGNFSVSIALNPALPRLYIANNGTNDLSVIDTDTRTVVATVPVWFWPTSVAVHPDGTRAYVASQGAYIAHVAIIDTATNIRHDIEVDGNAFGVAVHPSGHRLYVTSGCESSCPGQPDGCDPPPCPSTGQVEVIDTATEQVVTKIPVGKWPRGIVLNASGTRAYVANWGNQEGNTVSVINTASNAVLGTLTTGPGPWALGLSPDGDKLYVVNNGDSTLSILELTGELRGASGSSRDASVPLTGPTQARGSITGSVAVPDGCGDSTVVPPEACDDGNVVSGDGCDSNCTVSACGNGVLAGAEQCDDGNVVDGDDCSSTCVLTGCGDGAVTFGEDCDDGNVADCDTCSPSCEVTVPCRCGDGAVTAGEACDDGNEADGDGCDDTCRFEMIPGGSGRDADCFSEWVVVNPGADPLYDRDGRHTRKQACQDGDNTCDQDGVADGDCVFRVRVCTAVTDAELGCSIDTLDSAEVVRPSASDAERSVEAAAIRSQLDVLQTLITQGPDSCSDPLDMSVALRSAATSPRPGKRGLKTTVSVGETRDRDSLKLICRP